MHACEGYQHFIKSDQKMKGCQIKGWIQQVCTYLYYNPVSSNSSSLITPNLLTPSQYTFPKSTHRHSNLHYTNCCNFICALQHNTGSVKTLPQMLQ